jgi:hypothetical protein
VPAAAEEEGGRGSNRACLRGFCEWWSGYLNNSIESALYLEAGVLQPRGWLMWRLAWQQQAKALAAAPVAVSVCAHGCCSRKGRSC